MKKLMFALLVCSAFSSCERCGHVVYVDPYDPADRVYTEPYERTTERVYDVNGNLIEERGVIIERCPNSCYPIHPCHPCPHYYHPELDG